MRERIISVKASLLVYNHGGYLGTTCLVCNQSGWKEGKAGLGYPYGHKHPLVSALQHTKTCPVGAVLDSEGAYAPAPRSEACNDNARLAR